MYVLIGLHSACHVRVEGGITALGVGTKHVHTRILTHLNVFRDHGKEGK